jgi:hypothetical protein
MAGKKKTTAKKKGVALSIKEWVKSAMKPIAPKPRLTSGNTNTRKLLKQVK